MWTHNCDKNLLTEIFELSWKGLATKKEIYEWQTEKRNEPLTARFCNIGAA